MDKMKKKRMKKYIAWICIVVLVVFLAVMPLLAGTGEAADGPQASILSGRAETRDITTRLLGGGILTAEEPVEITVPSAVKLTDFLVSNGDRVTAGDAIASVDRVSVMSAITEVQETLDYLAEEIEAAADDSVSESVTARAGGTVKILYAAEGDSVEEVMLEHGALAVLSLDGLMAVTVERSTDLAAGDSVIVTLSDETEVTGRVESNLDGVLVVTVSDDGYAVGQQVFVTSEDGDRLGTGELYIHSPWNATAYAGTVSDIRASENQKVSAGNTLMTLKDTGFTAAYSQLTAQHREYEKLMLELFQIYQTTVVTAPCDGVVSGVDEDSLQLLSAGEQRYTISWLANAPNGDDETQYQNYVGQVTAAGIDGLILKMNPQNIEITDYTDLSGVPTDPAAMTQEVIYNGSAPVYELVGGDWQQIERSSIAAGDILLFAGDAQGNFVWIVRVSRGMAEEGPSEPTQPEQPTEPEASEPTEPAEPETPTEPTIPSDQIQPGQSGSGMGQMGGALSGILSGFGMGGMIQEEQFEVYSLETVTIAAVTAQDTMTLEITVDELDISKLSIGMEAAVTVDALSGDNFTGIITDIGSTGTTNGGNSKFTVELTLPRSDNMLSGMNAAVSIRLDGISQVLTVPVEALAEKGTETVIYTGYDEDDEVLTDPVTVTTGVSDGSYVQILTGLDSGAEFYYAYYDTLEISNAVQSGRFGMFG